MAVSCNQPQTEPPPKEEVVSHLRSVQYSRPFIRAVFFTALHYMGILGAATTLAILLVEPSPLAIRTLVAFLCFSAVSWLISYFKRRSTFCPLCKGTPLMNSGAIPHKNATRIFPFDHGVSAVLSIIATQKFRCMYCGTGFDILKEQSQQRGDGGPDYRDTTYTPEKPS